MHLKNNYSNRLDGQVAIVTAATKGIGLATAERLAKEGSYVVISSRKQNNVDESLKYLQKSGINSDKIAGITCHVGNANDRQKLIDFTIEKFKKITILVNNAGISPSFDDIMDIKESVYDKLFETNVKSGFMLTRLVVPYMIKEGGGNIIFNASYTAYRPPKGIQIYGVTKTALIGLTKAFADSLADKNIRVNAVAPGVIRTKFSEPLYAGGKSVEDGLLEANQVPIKRLGEPSEIASAIAFLVSNDASYITGETMIISGGIHCRL